MENLSKEKQIEEMQKDIMENTAVYDSDVAQDVAEILICKGYRKASEVVEEVVGEIEKINTQYCTTIASAVIKAHLEAIRKKYTEDSNNG